MKNIRSIDNTVFVCTSKVQRQKKYSAFTLAEMMVVLCVLSLVTAAFLPVITTRSKATPGSIWKWAANNTDIYFGTGNTQGAAIGTNGLGGNNTRLLLNTVAGQDAIFFQQNGINTGRLTVTGTGTDPENSVGLGNVVLPTTFDYAVAIGGTDGTNLTEASRLNSTAVGSGARAITANWTTAIGASSQASGTNATALGVSSQATGLNTISIGQGSTASASNTTVLGQGATANNDESIAIGGSSTNKSLNTLASGTFSIAIGNGSHATATSSTAIGYEASVPSQCAVALGYGTSIGANSDNSTAIGFGSIVAASSIDSIAMGCGAQAIKPGDAAIAPPGGAPAAPLAIGYYAISKDFATSSVGYNSQSLKPYCTAFGYKAKADDTAGNSGTYGYSTAVGCQAQAINYQTLALGYNSSASGKSSMAMGNTSIGSGANSMAMGYTSTASGASSAAVGYTSLASGDNSTAMGFNAQAKVIDSLAIGYWAQAINPGDTPNPAPGGLPAAPLALGYYAIAKDLAATAIGYNAQALRPYCTALGYKAMAADPSGYGDGVNYGYCTAIGYNAQATSYQALAVGTSSVASTMSSCAVGYNALAGNAGVGQRTTALGVYPRAYGDYAISIGYNNFATPMCSIAIGGIINQSNFNTTTGSYSISIGWQTNNANHYGDYSVALGSYSNSSGSNSVAIGYGANANSANVIQLGNGSMTDIYGPATTHWTSDRRLKNVGKKFDDGLDIIRKIQPYNYTMKADKKKTPRVGVIAQDLQKILPKAVSKNGNGYLSIRQDDMFYAMINSIKQLDVMLQGIIKDFKTVIAHIKQIDDKIIAMMNVDKVNSEKIKALEKENKELKAKNKSFEKENKQIEIKLAKLEKRIK